MKWTAWGFEYGAQPDLAASIDKLDDGLLEVLWPLAGELRSQNKITRWYTSRRIIPLNNAQGLCPCCRGRFYVELQEEVQTDVGAVVRQSAGCLFYPNVTPPTAASELAFDARQRGSEVARDRLGQIRSNGSREIHADRATIAPGLLIDLEDIVSTEEILQRYDGIHWIENNLGLGEALQDRIKKRVRNAGVARADEMLRRCALAQQQGDQARYEGAFDRLCEALYGT